MRPTFDAVGVVVADMAAAVAFYRTLGLDFEAGAEGDSHAEAVGAGGFRLMLDTEEVVASFDASWTPPPPGRGRIGLAFACNGPDEVDAAHRRLVDAGHRSHLEPFDAFWGQRYGSVLDPDGNVVDLFAALEARTASE